MKLTKQDWLEHGLDILARLGPEHLKIDRLCSHLGVTKGSFYHYFSHRDDYVAALLDHWQSRNTRDIIAAVETIAHLPERSLALSDITQAVDTGPENAIRAWALYDPQVARCLEAVDRERMAYLTQLITPQVPTPSQGELIAKLVYAHFVGTQQLGSLVSAQEWSAMDDLLRGLLTDQPRDTRE